MMSILSTSTIDDVRELARSRGQDAAVDRLLTILRQTPAHQSLIEAIDTEAPFAPSSDRPRAMVVVVPGSFYRDKPGAGTGQFVLDLAKSRGHAVDRIPVESFGRVSRASALIVDWLSRRREERIILVSISKGSAEVRHALALPGAVDAFAPVSTWISLSGMPLGTPLANWLLERRLPRLIARFVFWRQGHDFAAFEELRHGPGTLLDAPVVLPATLRAIHVAGFPRQEVLDAGPLKFLDKDMLRHGPHDGGGVALTDLLRLPGEVYPIEGGDHSIGAAWRVARVIPRLLAYASQ